MKNSPCKLTAGSGFESGKNDNIAATEPGLGVDGASSRPKLSSPGSPLTLRTMLVTILEIGEEEDSGGDDAERCVCAGFAACSDLVSLGSTKFDTGYSSGVEGPQPIPPSPLPIEVIAMRRPRTPFRTSLKSLLCCCSTQRAYAPDP